MKTKKQTVIQMQKLSKKLISIMLTAFLVLSLSHVVSGQETKDAETPGELEAMEDENMDYLRQIYEIIEDYPAFSYSYTIEDGEVQDVVVEGVESDLDRKRLEVILFDLKSNRNKMKSKSNRIGVFYSVDEEAEYSGSESDLQDKILNNLTYPDRAKDWGVEGTIYVKFVVDDNGQIPFATTSTNINTSVDRYLDQLEKQAVEAVKATSGEWDPGKVDGVEVASMVVMPVTFDFEKNPTLPAIIR